jgi:hypothetical protein
VNIYKNVQVQPGITPALSSINKPDNPGASVDLLGPYQHDKSSSNITGIIDSRRGEFIRAKPWDITASMLIHQYTIYEFSASVS